MTFTATEIKELMVSLASVCDHAVKKDYMGFSKATAPSGHYIALMNSDDYKEQHLLLGSSIAKVHMKQLGLSESLFDESTPKIKDINSFVHVPHIYCENGDWELYCTKSDSMAYKLAKYISMNATDGLMTEKEVGHGFRFKFRCMDTAFLFTNLVANSHGTKASPIYSIIESDNGNELLFNKHLAGSRFVVVKDKDEFLFKIFSVDEHHWIRFTCDTSQIDLESYLEKIEDDQLPLKVSHRLKLLDVPKVKSAILDSKASVDELYEAFVEMKSESNQFLEIHSYFTNYKPRTVFFFPYQTSDDIFAGTQYLRDDIEPFLKKYCKTPESVYILLNKLKIDKKVTKTFSFAKISCSPALLLAVIDYLNFNQISHNITKAEIDKLKTINSYIDDILFNEYKSKRTIVVNERSLILPNPLLNKYDAILSDFSLYNFEHYKGIPAVVVKLDPRFYHNDMATLNELMERYHFYFENDDSKEYDSLLKSIAEAAKEKDEPLPNGFIHHSEVRKSILVAEFSFSYLSVDHVKKFPADTRRFNGNAWIIDTSTKPKECLEVLYRLKELNWYIDDKVFFELKNRIHKTEL